MSGIDLSIIVPAFNREKTIWSALTSIGHKIPLNCEIIVVDDGSTDGTVDEAMRALGGMSVKHSQIIRQQNAGPGAARNLGAAQAKGAFLVFLDSDDLWCEGTLTTLLTASQQVPEIALMFFQSCDFTGNYTKCAHKTRQEIGLFDSFIAATTSGIKTRFASCNVLIPRSVFEAVSGFDETLPCSEDTDLFLRVDQSAPTAVIYGDPMIAHRVDPSDRLSCDAPKVVQGFRDMILKDKAGAYGTNPQQAQSTRAFLAGSAVYAIRVAFAQGQVGLAYGTFFKVLPLLMAHKRQWVWRLFFTPVLAMLRPQSYPFQWQSNTAPGTPKDHQRDTAFTQNRVSSSEHWPVG